MGSIYKEYCVIVDKKTEGIRKGSAYGGKTGLDVVMACRRGTVCQAVRDAGKERDPG